MLVHHLYRKDILAVYVCERVRDALPGHSFLHNQLQSRELDAGDVPFLPIVEEHPLGFFRKVFLGLLQFGQILLHQAGGDIDLMPAAIPQIP